MKHLFVLRAFKSALAAVLIISLLSCGGDKADTASGPAPTSLGVPQVPTAAITGTQADLAKFWSKYGAKETFPPMYVELLIKTLEAEDKVLAKDYTGARAILDVLIAKYPLIDNNESTEALWWNNFSSIASRSTPRPHLGEPGVYAALRMLDDITRVGVTKPLEGSTPIRMVVIMPACSNIVPKSGPTQMNHRLSPEIEENSYEAVHQSLRLFQSYILAISGGKLRLELVLQKLDKCFELNAEKNYTGNYQTQIDELPQDIIDKADMFWLIYPYDYESSGDIGGGGGIYVGGKHILISEDDWVLKRNGSQGGGFRTEVERRMYLPEWVQHEFFHVLFGTWPEFNLEATDHSWFDRSTWPSDFVGRQEEDYYSEALRKRLFTAPISISEKLKISTK